MTRRGVFCILSASSSAVREALLELREEVKDFMDIQIVAFPQYGILSYPKGKELLEDSLKMGAAAAGAPAGPNRAPAQIKPYFLRRARSFCSSGLPRRNAQYQNGERTRSNSPASSVTPTAWQNPSLKRYSPFSFCREYTPPKS